MPSTRHLGLAGLAVFICIVALVSFTINVDVADRITSEPRLTDTTKPIDATDISTSESPEYEAETTKPVVEEHLNFILLGDYGEDTNAYKNVLKRLKTVKTDFLNTSKQIQMGISVGDNFYHEGVKNLQDPLFKRIYEDKLAMLGLPWYLTVGNHDCRQKGSVAAQIAYSEIFDKWNMPNRYFSIHTSLVDFFFMEGCTLECNVDIEKEPPEKDIDCVDALSAEYANEMLLWLEKELSSSKATYKMVINHWPIYSATTNGHGDFVKLQDHFLPLFKKYNVLFYFFGHDHLLQHLKVNHDIGSVTHLFGSGGGGYNNLHTIDTEHKKLVKAYKQHGFMTFQVSKKEVKVDFWGTHDNNPLYSINIDSNGVIKNKN